MSISRNKRLRIYARDGFKCLKCKSPDNLSIDHIIPQSQGGSNDPKNLRTLCQKCNMERGNYHPTLFQKLFRFATLKDLNEMKNGLMGSFKSDHDMAIKQGDDHLEKRLLEIKPNVLGGVKELIESYKRELEVKHTGFENTDKANRQVLEERDDKILNILYLLSDRVEALEKYLDVEYVETKEYRKNNR